MYKNIKFKRNFENDADRNEKTCVWKCKVSSPVMALELSE